MSESLNSMPQTVEIVERVNCYQGFYRLDKLRLRHELFAGGLGREISRELFVRHDAVCVLPYDPQRDEVVLIEQFRVGALDKTQNPWLIELVAGLIDKDEQPEEVAHREAEEEAGLTFSALWPMTRYFPSPGGSDEFVHLFLGRCDSEGAGGLHGLEEEGEDIRVKVWSFEDALQAVRDGRIANAASIIAVQWLALNRDEVRGAVVVSPLRERYRVDLVGLQAACEANYARLMQLLPAMREGMGSRRIGMTQGDQMLGVLVLDVVLTCPYTTTLRVRQEHSLPWLPVPQLEVQVYHDAQMAEVISAEHARRLRSIYPYPNDAMHQPDEKAQLNLFLGEWLSHCLACGHELEAVR